MPTLYWSATADGNFTTAANWLDAAGAPAGAAPANSDTLIFNQGSIDVNAGLSGSLTGLTIIVLPQFTGSIGTLGAPLAQSSFADIQCAGSGRWYKFSGTVTKCNNVIGHATEFFCSGGAWGTSTATTPLRFGGPGRVWFEAAATFASSSSIYNAGAQIMIAAGTATNVPTVYNEMGTVVARRNVGSVFNSPGAIFRFEEAAAPSSGNAVHNWGTYYHWTTDTGMTVHAKSRSRLIVRGTKAITPTISVIFRLAGSTIQDREGGGPLTITTDVAVGDIVQPTRAMVAS